MAISENPIPADLVPPGEQPAKPKRNSNRLKDKKNQKPKFKGEINDMNGLVFQPSEESKEPTQFVRTLKALERLTHKTYKSDMSSIFDKPKGTIPSIPKPLPHGADADEYDKEAFTVKLKDHIAEEKQLTNEIKPLWSVI